MKYHNTQADVEILRKELLANKKKREELRNESNKISRVITSLRARIRYCENQLEYDEAHCQYLKSALAERKEIVATLKKQIKELSKVIVVQVASLHYYDNNAIDHSPRTESLIFQLYGKPFRELTVDERKEYNKVIQTRYRRKNK